MTDNLLTNGGFEAEGWTNETHIFPVGDEPYITEISNIFAPENWVAWFVHDPDIYDQPEMRDTRAVDPDRMRSGEKGFLCFTFYRRHNAGIMQTVGVEPGKKYEFSAWAHAWSNWQDGPHPDDPGWSDHEHDGYAFVYLAPDETLGEGDRNFSFLVGIDPYGGEDPTADSVVWGEVRHIYGGSNGEFGRVEVEAVAESDTITVFLRSVVMMPFKHCDAYWDDASLVVVEEIPDVREDYKRVYVLLPPTAGVEWFEAAARGSFISRSTIGFSADDAGIGRLSERVVRAVNPDEWGDDLQAFFEMYYPGVTYAPLYVDTPEELEAALKEKPFPPRPPDYADWFDYLLCQCDPSWNDVPFGDSECNQTIGQAGCFIACLAMAQNIYGLRTSANPLTVDAELGDDGYDGCVALPSAIESELGLSITSSGDLDAHLVSGEVAMIEVQRPTLQHFVLAVEVLPDGDYLVLDPWHGSVGPLSELYEGIESSRLLSANVTDPPEPPPVDWGDTVAHIGLHHQSGTPNADDFVEMAKPRVCKIFGIGDTAWIQAASPDTRIVWRRWADDIIGALLAMPTVAAVEYWINLISPELEAVAGQFTQNKLYVESPLNEVGIWVDQRAVDFEAHYARRLPERFPHCRAVCLLIPIGNPPGDEAQFRAYVDFMTPVAQAVYDTSGMLGYHAYYGADPTHDWFESTYPGMAGRWERMDAIWRESGIFCQWALTEGGVAAADNNGYGLAVGQGWKGDQCMEGDEARYLTSLMQYEEAIGAWNAAHSDRCGGVCIFTSPGDGAWESFGVAGEFLVHLGEMYAGE
jgi:hypothetical protein